jgi:hypothetical protein
MSSENITKGKSETENVVESYKEKSSRFLSLNFFNSSKKCFGKKKYNKRKKTKQVNHPIAEKSSSANIAHCKTGIDDLFVFEYELTRLTLKKSKIIALN